MEKREYKVAPGLTKNCTIKLFGKSRRQTTMALNTQKCRYVHMSNEHQTISFGKYEVI